MTNDRRSTAMAGDMTWDSPELRSLAMVRIVCVGLFLALVWKWQFFRGIDAIYAAFPIRDPFFPAWLQSLSVLRTAYWVTLAGIVIVFISEPDRSRRIAAWMVLISTSVLCLHQGSYNDMTFVTAWWTALWLVWFVMARGPESEARLRRAALLSRLIISLIFLGGAVGKWTPEYLDGDVLFDIYFRDRNFWLFNWLRASFADDSLRRIATWYSRQVVAVETVCGFGLWVLPPRWAAAVGVVVLTSIALFSNFLLFSVLLSLIGLAAVGWLVDRGQKVDGQATS